MLDGLYVGLQQLLSSPKHLYKIPYVLMAAISAVYMLTDILKFPGLIIINTI